MFLSLLERWPASFMCGPGVGCPNERRTVSVVQIERPEVRRDYPLNLSILLSGGEENNNDPLSNGE